MAARPLLAAHLVRPMIAPEKERSERENGDRPRFIQYRSLGKRLDQEWETVVCPRFCADSVSPILMQLWEDCMLIKNITILLICIFMGGCATNRVMDASYSSQVDPDFSFTNDKRIVVLAPEQGNDLETKYYVSQVVEALKQRGFVDVYSYKDLPNVKEPVDIAVLISVSKKSDSYLYEGANYGMVDSGNSTVNCTGWGNSVNCTENKQKTFGVTGYSTKTGYLTGYYFSANWFNVKNEQKIMFSFASSYEEGCSDRAVYEFLISQTIARLDFTKPNEYDYSITMPETYNCNY